MAAARRKLRQGVAWDALLSRSRNADTPPREPVGGPDDGADLGGRSERVDESHSSYKQRMLRQRIEQALAEAEVAKQQLASYRAYQQRELDEVRQATAELNRLQLPE